MASADRKPGVKIRPSLLQFKLTHYPTQGQIANPNNKTQNERFIKTARALECDEDKERFREKLKRIATASPVDQREPSEIYGAAER